MWTREYPTASANGPSTGASSGSSPAAAVANAKAAALWPEGNDGERGIRISAGRTEGAGRRRRVSSLTGPLVVIAAIISASTPRPAAARPLRPPSSASRAAIASHSRQ